MGNKLLDFQANISEVKQINPSFSTCKVRVLYTGKNRNMTTITKEAVEKAIPTMMNIPIVGEFSTENEDYKGHGGSIDLDSYKFLHTTKPYGVVPESATYSWEEVKGSDGAVREYLTISGCYLWTGRYEEAYSIVNKGKGQSMEIEVTNGFWNDEQESYEINDFVFSALCILGDDVEPAFEEANIVAYSLNKDSFKNEFNQMLGELKFSLSKEKEVENMLKELLEKYSLKIEDLTDKGIDLKNISEDELEDEIIKAFDLKVEKPFTEDDEVVEPEVVEPKVEEPLDEPEIVEPQPEKGKVDEPEEGKSEGNLADVEPEKVADAKDNEEEDLDTEKPVKVETFTAEEVENLKSRITELEGKLEEFEALKEFKLKVEKSNHESKAQELFSNFQLTEEDVKELDVHSFSIEEIKEKCYAIIGKQMADKKNFSKSKENKNIHLPLNTDKNEIPDDGYNGLFERYKDKK